MAAQTQRSSGEYRLLRHETCRPFEEASITVRSVSFPSISPLFGSQKEKGVTNANKFRRRVALGQKTRPTATTHSKPCCRRNDCNSCFIDTPTPIDYGWGMGYCNNPRCTRHPSNSPTARPSHHIDCWAAPHHVCVGSHSQAVGDECIYLVAEKLR